jgi:carbonic anhydrase
LSAATTLCPPPDGWLGDFIMERLLEGYGAFRTRYPDGAPWDATRVGKGQSPRVVALTCSDSRVVLETVLSARPGDIFMLRNAGNFLPEAGTGSEEASLEYAISVLKVEALVICGHTHCGAVGALYQPPPKGDLPAVDRWLINGKGVTDRCPKPGEQSRDGVEANARMQVERAMTYPAVKKAVDAGKLTLHAWVYDIESGAITAYDEKTDAFVDL